MYADWLKSVEILDDAEAGRLLKHILRYVNDLNPEEPDRITQISFSPIQQQLKRDLKRWEEFRGKQAKNGKLGGRPVTQNNPNNPGLNLETQKSLTVTVTDTVNATVTEIPKTAVRENVFLKQKELEKLQMQFSPEDLNWMLDKLSAYKLSKGVKYKSDYGAINSWVTERLKEEKNKTGNDTKTGRAIRNF